MRVMVGAMDGMPEATVQAADAGEIGVSAVVVAEGDGAGLGDLLGSYLGALDACGAPFELVCVFDAASPAVAAVVDRLRADWPALAALPLRPWPGEDGALKVGIANARGAVLLTLPGWPEVDAEAIPRLVAALGDGDGNGGRDGEVDMIVGNRTGAARGPLQRLRMGATHGLIRLLFGQRFNDVFCRVRIGRSEVFRQIADLGVRQHFLPVLAVAEGYCVRERAVPQPKARTVQPSFNLWGHARALIDLLTLYIGLKFLRRPLRFFGAIGLPLALLGALATAYLVVARLAFGEPLADRPALVFAVLMLVLGVQIVALGLIGEIVIFASSRRMRTYEIDKIIRGRTDD
jgi:hypothetical protein